jgi:hypothetical protein
MTMESSVLDPSHGGRAPVPRPMRPWLAFPPTRIALLLSVRWLQPDATAKS